MRKTTLVLALLLSSSPLFAAGRHRIVGLPAAPQATLSGQVLDLVTNAPVVQVEVTGPRRYTRTDEEGKFTMQLPVGAPVELTFSRTGYETRTETITLTGNTTSSFRVEPRPTARITTTGGTTYNVDADSIEFGYAIPFMGYRRDRSAKMCRAGGTEFTLDRAEVDRIEGPAVTITDAACCSKGPVTGALFELATGERVTAYFLDSCDSGIMEVIARDHLTWNFVFVPFRELREVVIP